MDAIKILSTMVNLPLEHKQVLLQLIEKEINALRRSHHVTATYEYVEHLKEIAANIITGEQVDLDSLKADRRELMLSKKFKTRDAEPLDVAKLLPGREVISGIRVRAMIMALRDELEREDAILILASPEGNLLATCLQMNWIEIWKTMETVEAEASHLLTSAGYKVEL